MSNLSRLVSALETIAADPVHGVLDTDPEGATLINTAAIDSDLVLGGIYRYGAKLYKYVQFCDAVAYAAGDVCFPHSADCTQVTVDVSGATPASVAIAVGVVLGVQTENYYGFVLVRGDYATVNTNGDDDITEGLELKVTAADHGVVDSGSATPGSFIGWSTAADVDAANTVAAFIKIH